MDWINRVFDETYRSAWRRFIRLWKPMAGWTLLIWILFGIILSPLLSGALSRAVLRGDRILIGNEELLVWLLRPEGLAYVIVAGTLLLMGGVLRYAGLFRVVTDDLLGNPVSVRRVLFGLLPDAAALFRLCLAAVVIALILLAPLLASLGGIYLYWLGEHDINYYLEVRPREWRQAWWAVAICGVPWALGTGYLLLRSLPALPAFLDGHRPAKVALVRGWSHTRKGAFRLLRLLLLCIGTWWLSRMVAQAVLFFVVATGIEAMAGVGFSVMPILLATGAYTLAAIVLDAVLSFFGFSFAAIILTKFYYQETRLHAIAPDVTFGLSGLTGEVAATFRAWLKPVRAFPVMGGLLLLSGSISGWFLHQVGRDADFVVTAHRAGAFMGPENTLAALEASIEAGADFAEIDVQRTRDGVVVVLHDADLKRVAGDSRRVARTNYADLAGLTLGDDDTIPDELRRLPTLEEFMERSRGRIGLNIELKYYGWDPALVPAVIDLIRKHEMEDEVVLMSLDLQSVRDMQELAPDIPVGFVATVALGDLRRLPVDFLAVPRNVGTPRLIRAANARDMEVHIWTLNRADTLLDAVQRGADGVITDDPVLAVRIRDELARLTTLERILLAFRSVMFEAENGGELYDEERQESY